MRIYEHTNMQIFKYVNIQIFKYVNMQMIKCVNVQMFVVVTPPREMSTPYQGNCSLHPRDGNEGDDPHGGNNS
jgi:hypothetical protein